MLRQRLYILITAVLFILSTQMHAQEESEPTAKLIAVFPAAALDEEVPSYVPSVYTKVVATSLLVPLDYEVVSPQAVVQTVGQARIDGCASTECAAEIAREYGYTLFIASGISSAGDDGFTITSIFVDSETGEILGREIAENVTVESFLTTAKTLTRNLIAKGLPDGEALVEEEREQEEAAEAETKQKERIVEQILRNDGGLDPSMAPFIGEDEEEIKKQTSTAGVSSGWVYAGYVADTLTMDLSGFSTDLRILSWFDSNYLYNRYISLPSDTDSNVYDTVYTAYEQNYSVYQAMTIAQYSTAGTTVLGSTIQLFTPRTNLYVSSLGRGLVAVGSLMRGASALFSTMNWGNLHAELMRQEFPEYPDEPADLGRIEGMLLLNNAVRLGATLLSSSAPIIGGRRSPLIRSPLAKALNLFGRTLLSAGIFSSYYTVEMKYNLDETWDYYQSPDLSPEEYESAYADYKRQFSQYAVLGGTTYGMLTAGTLFSVLSVLLPEGRPTGETTAPRRAGEVSFSLQHSRGGAGLLVQLSM